MLSPDRIIETDGLGVDLMPVVCSWCKRDLPAKAWPTPVLPGQISHGICPKCADDMRSQFARSGGLSDVRDTAPSARREHALGSPASATFNTDPVL